MLFEHILQARQGLPMSGTQIKETGIRGLAERFLFEAIELFVHGTPGTAKLINVLCSAFIVGKSETSNL
jgi:hypothetical protein